MEDKTSPVHMVSPFNVSAMYVTLKKKVLETSDKCSLDLAQQTNTI